ncbi:inhibitor of growth protein 1 [Rhinichthys klamathensis goyatoka]|uniref:inhibitor of growth protein 1 n=1 Tax=Pimephales promelas TaxID=90988 RepID=UPI00195577AE|nr:inhibitor of growth protein 1 [Pimephales promelas]XP_056107794.1 inhibitor of growth protein 1 [Rhinichthys klamathensis goyatoka]KAG1945492.1 inhibitor of growth protein [Pimephales promelas]
MLNPSSNGESSHVVVKYVEEYLELVESLPLDLQRCVSLMKEIDARYQEILNELDEAYEKHRHESDPVQRRRLLHCIQRSLIRTEELGDEKIQIAGQMVEMVENRSRQLEWQGEIFQASQDSPESTVSVGSTPSAVATVTMTPLSAAMLSASKPSVDRRRDETPTSVDKSGGKRSRRQKNGSENRENSSCTMEQSEEVASGTPKEKKAKTSSTSSKKKKRSKSKQDREPSPTDLPIDPNEPTYCLCEQVSFGEMIGCDNEECTIEWFHFSCVGLYHKPKGKWYCPKCRGDNEKTMDKALERSKKDRSYNR